MNRTLGAGAEANGRPLLGGIGQVSESSSSRQGVGLPYVGVLEAFARAAGTAASFGGGGGALWGDQGGGHSSTNPEVIER